MQSTHRVTVMLVSARTAANAANAHTKSKLELDNIVLCFFRFRCFVFVVVVVATESSEWQGREQEHDKKKKHLFVDSFADGCCVQPDVWGLRKIFEIFKILLEP